MHIRQLTEIFQTAVESCQPQKLLPELLSVSSGFIHINNHRFNRTETGAICLIAAGKAAGAMAREAEKVFGSLIKEGLCVTKYGHALPLQRIRVIEAAHPEPDENSLLAGQVVHQLLNRLTGKEILLFLISGGASSLITDLPEGASENELREGYRLLVNSGADIKEINCVRKHLSRIKGGQLAKAAFPAPVISLLVSDVPGDDLQTIGSGITVPDPTSFEDALAVLNKYRLTDKFPLSLKIYLEKGSSGQYPETPKPGDPAFRFTINEIIASNKLALNTAISMAEKSGYHIWKTVTPITGETNEEALSFARLLQGYDGPLPAFFIRGGESTLRVSGNGKGGRNQHFALRILGSMKTDWKKQDRFAILCAGTDGTDGPTDAAGALIHTGMLNDPRLSLSSINTHLEQFNAYPLLAEAGGLYKTGPTQTNVMDLVIGILY